MIHQFVKDMCRRFVGLLLPLALVSSIALTSEAGAQGTIQGTVTEATTGLTVPGANVFLEETGQGTATDIDGFYQIENIDPGVYTLTVSFVGFRRYQTEVSVEAGETVVENIELVEDRLGLDEVVVTGQGAAVETRRLSTTIEVITPRQIEQTPATRIDELLQAQLPGSQVRFTSGQPGTASMIRSRGVLSALSATTPVIYIDGVRVDNLNTAAALGLDTGGAQSSAIPDIPLENIERIEFTKGGAATTLYGSDAANGVLQIFTKRGLPGRTNLTYETSLGWMQGTKDFLFYKETADILYEPGLVQQHRLSGSGGIEDFTYSFSGMMYEDNGFRLGNEEIRYGFRTGVSGALTPITRYTGSMAFSSNRFTRDYNANTSWAQFGNLESGAFGPLDELDEEEMAETRQFVRDAVRLTDIQGDVKRFQSSHNIEINPHPSLTGRFTAGLDYRVAEEQNVTSAGFLRQIGSASLPFIERTNRRFLGLTLEATGQHQAEVGNLSFVTTFGGQVFRDEDMQTFVSAENIAEGTTSINNAATQDAEDFQRIVANYGVYLVENIGFWNRLFIEGGVRIDGNSAFGEEIGAVVYPKIGASYSISDEPFLRQNLGLGGSILSSLKLRTNLGFAGNFPTPFANFREVQTAPLLGQTAVTFGQFGNVDLKPERVRTWEVGGDLSLFNDLATFEITYYNARTFDALFDVRFPPSAGRFEQLANVGEIVNKGWEINSQFFPVSTRNLDLRIGASLNTLDNEVVNMGGAAPFAIGGFTFLGQWVVEGFPVGMLRGAQPTFDDQGNVVDIERNAFLGSPLPDAYGNLSLNLTFRNRLRFTTVADYQWGGQGVATDDVLRFFSGLQDPNRFPRNDEGEIPALDQASFFDLAGVFVEDTDYLKVRLISLSYTVPERFFPVNNLRTLEVGVRVVNPFNWASSTFDPEITGANASAQGGVNVGAFGFGTESPPRQFLFNLRVGL